MRDTDSACALFLRETAQNTGRRPSVFLTRKTTTQRGFKHCGVKKGTEVPLASSPRVSEMADGASASLGRANPQQPAFRSRKGGTTASPRAQVGPAAFSCQVIFPTLPRNWDIVARGEKLLMSSLVAKRKGPEALTGASRLFGDESRPLCASPPVGLCADMKTLRPRVRYPGVHRAPGHLV